DLTDYARVVAKGVYPGVDVAYYGNSSRALEYDFLVGPGADPSAIRLKWEGAAGLSLDEQGDLLVSTAGGTLVQQAPLAYQDGAPGQVRATVTAGYTLLPGGDVGISLGAYDAGRPLVVDPVIAFSSYLGGSGDDKAYAV